MGKSYRSRKIGLEVLLCLYSCVGRHRHLHYFLFPETKGRALEEIAEVFDGPNTAVHIDSKLEHDASYKNGEVSGSRDLTHCFVPKNRPPQR